ncbi:MAG: ABC transporter ATP-binding protein [Bacilli bacterium]|nr:ABC transporter ATP-binding protein [Bacilli bacterium]
MKKLIELKQIKKEYKMKNKSLLVLENLDLSFEKGKFYAIMGHSGSGKSTLINIIGLLDSATYGEYSLDGQNVFALSENELARLRRDKMGFIFQDYFLDEYFKAYENVMYPMLINENIPKNEMRGKAIKLLAKVDLEDRVDHFPKEMSGGEKQRVAIARALANDPDIIIADEPTGNLDKTNEKKIFNLLKKLSEDGKCIIVVSHSDEVKKYADKLYELDDKHVIEVKR